MLWMKSYLVRQPSPIQRFTISNRPMWKSPMNSRNNVINFYDVFIMSNKIFDSRVLHTAQIYCRVRMVLLGRPANWMEYGKISIQRNRFIYRRSKRTIWTDTEHVCFSSTPRQSATMEAQEMNAMVDDIERALSQIAKQLKQVTISWD